jgi:hypothetical protein
MENLDRHQVGLPIQVHRKQARIASGGIMITLLSVLFTTAAFVALIRVLSIAFGE